MLSSVLICIQIVLLLNFKYIAKIIDFTRLILQINATFFYFCVESHSAWVLYKSMLYPSFHWHIILDFLESSSMWKCREEFLNIKSRERLFWSKNINHFNFFSKQRNEGITHTPILQKTFILWDLPLPITNSDYWFFIPQFTKFISENFQCRLWVKYQHNSSKQYNWLMPRLKIQKKIRDEKKKKEKKPQKTTKWTGNKAIVT